MSISQRTIKLILATCLACLVASFLDLSSAVSADPLYVWLKDQFHYSIKPLKSSPGHSDKEIQDPD